MSRNAPTAQGSRRRMWSGTLLQPSSGFKVHRAEERHLLLHELETKKNRGRNKIKGREKSRCSGMGVWYLLLQLLRTQHFCSSAIYISIISNPHDQFTSDIPVNLLGAAIKTWSNNAVLPNGSVRNCRIQKGPLREAASFVVADWFAYAHLIARCCRIQDLKRTRKRIKHTLSIEVVAAVQLKPHLLPLKY